MDDVAKWLSELDLGKYADVFAENDVGSDILPRLTEEHLKELGVSLGDRLRLLEAIDSLVVSQGGNKKADPPSDATSDVAVAPSEAERRQLTVMFCDLVGSTEMSTRLDPEDLQEVIKAYQEACGNVIARYDGFIAKYMGDGVLVYFGYPQAHGNDSERAVRAGLDIVEAVANAGGARETTGNENLAVRVGIDTGLVVVGDIVGEGAAEEASVVGETPNIAARLQALAQPNQVVIGPLTHELIGEVFACDDLGGQNLKGVAEPVHAWSVEREGDLNGNEEAVRAKSGLPLVGRQEELGLLLRAWGASKEDHGQVVLVQGEAGIGKSRLVEALRAEISGEDHLWVAIQCSPYHANSTLYPVIEHMKRAMRWRPEDNTEEKLSKLEAALDRQSLPPNEAVPLFVEMMSLPLPEGRFPPMALSPQQKRERTLDALAGWLLEEAENKPVLHLWEDLHWADPTTLEYLSLLIEQSPTVPILNVLTYRPQFVPPWTMHSHMTPITLNRLERPEVEALIGNQARGKKVPDAVIDHIASKADGVPLYVEELTRTILDSDYMREEADHYALVGSLSELSVPETLKDTLMARLDRVPQTREIAQLAAVLGREFAYEMLLAIADVDEPTLRDGLDQLVDAELFYQRGRPPRAKYIFKHALVQDAAYDSLLKRKRRHYHQQVAAVLESRFPEIVAAQPELLAHHFAMADRTDQAVIYCQKAGQLALERSANVEAGTHYERGLELLSQLPETPERDERELEMQMALGPALVAARGFADSAIGCAYARARELCRLIGDDSRLPLVLRGLQVFHLMSGEPNKAREFATQFLDLAERQGDPALLVGSYHALGQTLFFSGDLIAARRTVEKGIDLFDPRQHRLANWSGGQPGEQCYLYGGFALWMLGYPDQALKLATDALAMAEELKNPVNLINTLAFVATVHQLRRESAAARKRAKATMELSAEQGHPSFLGVGTILHGWAQAAQDQGEDSIAEIEQGIAAYRATGIQTWVPYFLGLQAETYARVERIDDGLASVAEGLALVEKAEERCWEAELFRIKGELLAESSHSLAEAEKCFSKALDIARRQEARSWELRAAVSLGRLWRRQNKKRDACDLLAPIYGWFTEGLDTGDLKEAKALLDDSMAARNARAG